MTLPDFAYPDQHRYGIFNYADRLAARILQDQEHDDDRRAAERDGCHTDTDGDA